MWKLHGKKELIIKLKELIETIESIQKENEWKYAATLNELYRSFDNVNEMMVEAIKEIK